MEGAAHPNYPKSRSDINSANQASYQEALIISAVVLLLTVDAWRLAALNNEEWARS